ncbi:hypothetical protein AMTR_s00147p00042930 [Amborella trichopoda]|uniref:AP complex mu/sigma subunit domain-containing protein n=1 Tax=Amborella trichopoda TaxID=13333 RepID=W1PBE4_AMBTC|nr:hypothetical protein AMTR_s00147p00042930 [Amborella trichopoda]
MPMVEILEIVAKMFLVILEVVEQIFYIIIFCLCKVIRELSGVILMRGPKLCNFVEWRGFKVIYKRYASLYFCMCIDADDNELEILEIIHHFVEILDRYFGSVSIFLCLLNCIPLC